MKTRILTPNEKSYQMVVQELQADNVVALPTETVYGLAGRAFSEAAVSKIFSVKERPHFDPLILHVKAPLKGNASIGYLDSLELINRVNIYPQTALKVDKLMSHFWPGPLTLVLPKSPRVPHLATSGLETVAIRIPKHKVFQEVLQRLDEPLAAPSANRFGRISPTSSKAVEAELGGRISYILDGGECLVGVESTIVGINEQNEFVLLRPGGLSVNDIEMVLGAKIHRQSPSEKPVAPGMMKSHYAPRRPMCVFSKPINQMSRDEILHFIKTNLNLGDQKVRVGFLLKNATHKETFKSLRKEIERDIEIRFLSRYDDLDESARNLFKYMRELDQLDVQVIFAEPWPDQSGIGFAIQDRLLRASAR